MQDVNRYLENGPDGQTRILDGMNALKNIIGNYLMSNSYERPFNSSGLNMEQRVFKLQNFEGVAGSIEAHIREYSGVEDVTVSFTKNEKDLYFDIKVSASGKEETYSYKLEQ